MHFHEFGPALFFVAKFRKFYIANSNDSLKKYTKKKKIIFKTSSIAKFIYMVQVSKKR
jgi:hypothetical protein